MIQNNWVLPFAITVIYAAFTVVVGFMAGRGTDMKKSENWGNSGNSINQITMFFLMGSSLISAYTFMGAPGWAFEKGVGILYVSVYLACMQLMGYLVNPRIVNMALKTKIATQPEAFGVRYESRLVRILGCIAGSITLVAYSVVQIVGCGYIINVMSGGNIPLWLAEFLILIVIFVYVYASGLKAIGWVSVLQGLLMFLVAFIVGGLVMKQFTGTFFWGATFERLLQISPQHLTLPGAANDFTPAFWTTSILISVISIWPNTWISASGGKDVDSVRRATSLTPLYQLIMVPMMIVGFICIFAMPYYEGAADKVALTLALDNLPWYLAGILGAGTLAAAQSSCAPLFQALALQWTHDIFVPLGIVKEEKKGNVQRWMLLPFMFLVVLPLSIINPGSLVYILLVGYGFLAQVFPMIVGIFVWPRSTKEGAIAGLAVGILITIAFSFGITPFGTHPLGIHAGIWGIIPNFIVHIIVSLMTKPVSRKTVEIFFSESLVEELYE